MKNIRDAFPILSKYTYLNTARYCALPQSGINIQNDFLEHLQNHGSWNFDQWSTLYEETRVKSAKLVGCRSDQLFFLPNVSLGFNMAAQYFPKRKVICLADDFPSVNIAWEPHGFEVTYLDYKAENFYDQLLNELAEPQNILSVSWIQSADGFEIDLPLIYQICKEKNHLLILDGTQGLGAIPFQIDPEVDCLFLASGFKWLMAGYGIAVAYASKRILKYLKPMRGWNSGFSPDGNISEGAKSLEVGNATYLNVAALSEGLKFIEELSVSAINEQNHQLRLVIENSCKATHRAFKKYDTRSSIITIAASDDEYEALVKNKVQVTKQSGFIRVSPNFYNNAEDIQKMLAVIA
ncbi:MAG: selenocysteine lyase/cysteine desulfurase [Cyclobacteriaceae bacterium]|jgi:selenocysteine lyase/cysteine desulfurase